MTILYAWPKILTQNYREQIQEVVRAGLELAGFGSQVQRSNLSAMPPPTKDGEDDYLVIQRGSVLNRTIKTFFDVTLRQIE